MLCKLIEEYESRNIAVITLGTDTGLLCGRNRHLISGVVSNYRKWIKDIEELQEVKVNIPLVSDPECILLRTVCLSFEFVGVSCCLLDGMC